MLGRGIPNAVDRRAFTNLSVGKRSLDSDLVAFFRRLNLPTVDLEASNFFFQEPVRQDIAQAVTLLNLTVGNWHSDYTLLRPEFLYAPDQLCTAG